MVLQDRYDLMEIEMINMRAALKEMVKDVS